ncbi:MAG: DUF3102 domain-containing protein [Gemmataceae bacterium]
MDQVNGRTWSDEELKAMSEADFVAHVNDAHGRFLSGIRTSIEAAFEAGQLLVYKKKTVKRGQFMPWVKENCRFSQRTANNFMDIAANWNNVVKLWTERGDHLNIYTALKEITVERVKTGKTKARGKNSTKDTSPAKSFTESKPTSTSPTFTADNTGNPAPVTGIRLFTETNGMETGDTTVPAAPSPGLTPQRLRLEYRIDAALDRAKAAAIEPAKLVKRLSEFGVPLHEDHVVGIVGFLLFCGLTPDAITELLA